MTSTATSLIRVPSPLGRLEITSDSEQILSLSIERGGHLPLEGTPDMPSPVLLKAAQQLAEYFAGTRTSFDLAVRLTDGTTFQQAVWNRLATLGFGEYLSY